MAIEVSDGFGIVFRAIRVNHQTFALHNIVIKYLGLSKTVTNNQKSKQQILVDQLNGRALVYLNILISIIQSRELSQIGNRFRNMLIYQHKKLNAQILFSHFNVQHR